MEELPDLRSSPLFSEFSHSILDDSDSDIEVKQSGSPTLPMQHEFLQSDDNLNELDPKPFHTYPSFPNTELNSYDSDSDPEEKKSGSLSPNSPTGPMAIELYQSHNDSDVADPTPNQENIALPAAVSQLSDTELNSSASAVSSSSSSSSLPSSSASDSAMVVSSVVSSAAALSQTKKGSRKQKSNKRRGDEHYESKKAKKPRAAKPQQTKVVSAQDQVNQAQYVADCLGDQKEKFPGITTIIFSSLRHTDSSPFGLISTSFTSSAAYESGYEFKFRFDEVRAATNGTNRKTNDGYFWAVFILDFPGMSNVCIGLPMQYWKSRSRSYYNNSKRWPKKESDGKMKVIYGPTTLPLKPLAELNGDFGSAQQVLSELVFTVNGHADYRSCVIARGKNHEPTSKNANTLDVFQPNAGGATVAVRIPSRFALERAGVMLLRNNGRRKYSNLLTYYSNERENHICHNSVKLTISCQHF